MTETTYSIAVFPFLKTSGPALIGGLTFRPTEDTKGLPPEQAAAVSEIADMLFLQDDLRIHSASYAVVAGLDLGGPSPDVAHLADVQAVVAYLYASSDTVFGRVFLSSEHASLAVFSPGRVSRYSVRPDSDVRPVGDGSDAPDAYDFVAGYTGLYNFRHHFQVACGSRVYGPQPRLTLNQSQDLGRDIAVASSGRSQYRLLLRALESPETATSSRVLTAVRWFNEACCEGNDEDASVVSLAIAFESLLGLPETEKTDRLVDAIALLLGRLPRLDVWARQFYDARSRVVHEGRADRLLFVATDSRKASDGPTCQPLVSYGRRIFRFCLATLLFGADLARQEGLEEQLVTNQERLAKVCRILSEERLPPLERLAQIEPLVDALERYRFRSESGLKLETMLRATELAAKALLACDDSLAGAVKQDLEALAGPWRDDDQFDELDVLSRLSKESPGRGPLAATVAKLIGVVWHYTFIHHFWLKERHSPRSEGTQGFTAGEGHR